MVDEDVLLDENVLLMLTKVTYALSPSLLIHLTNGNKVAPVITITQALLALYIITRDESIVRGSFKAAITYWINTWIAELTYNSILPTFTIVIYTLYILYLTHFDLYYEYEEDEQDAGD